MFVHSVDLSRHSEYLTPECQFEKPIKFCSKFLFESRILAHFRCWTTECSQFNGILGTGITEKQREGKTNISFGKKPHQYRLWGALMRNMSNGTGVGQRDAAIKRATGKGRTPPPAHHSPGSKHHRRSGRYNSRPNVLKETATWYFGVHLSLHELRVTGHPKGQRAISLFLCSSDTYLIFQRFWAWKFTKIVTNASAMARYGR